VDHELVAGKCAHGEAVDRANAHLAGPVDVERTDGRHRQSEFVEVRVCEVLTGKLRHGVRPARFADRAATCHVCLLDAVCMRPEDLARREIDEPFERRQRRLRRFEHVVRPDQIYPHRAHRAVEHSVDAGDRGAVDDVCRALREVAHELRVEDVALMQREVRVVGEVGPRQRVAMEIVERDHLVGVDE